MLENSNNAAEAISGLCPSLRDRLMPYMTRDVREVRLIKGCPPTVCTASGAVVLSGAVTEHEIGQSVLGLCGHSIHTHQQELAEGFISLPNGHRAGVSGRAVLKPDGTVGSVVDINSIVIRVAHRISGPGKRLLPQLFGQGLCGVLIAGAPGSGKTTLLRELATLLAGGAVPGCTGVAVVDERGELSWGTSGCCIIKGCPKDIGIISAVRSLSPQVVLCDEVGRREDVEAVSWALNCGVSVITTIHSRSMGELMSRMAGRELIKTGAFGRVVVLDSPGKIKEVQRLDERCKTDGGSYAGCELFPGRHYKGAWGFNEGAAAGEGFGNAV